jgi:hypothetical protein
MAEDAAIREASRVAQNHVAAAIAVIVALGPDAPSTLREANTQLGQAFTALGWGDPSVPYSIPRESDRA